jgi:hypothetical protein
MNPKAQSRLSEKPARQKPQSPTLLSDSHGPGLFPLRPPRTSREVFPDTFTNSRARYDLLTAYMIMGLPGAQPRKCEYRRERL